MSGMDCNYLQQQLKQGGVAAGFWCTLSDALSTEVVAGSGADWVMIDGEHSPNDIRSIMTQLHAVSAYKAEPVVRVPVNDAVLIKQYLDVGVRSLMVPNINHAAAARKLVEATRYPPRGIRGYSSAHRANRFGRISDYPHTAEDSLLLIAQIETPEAVANAAEIAAVDGVDVVFVGPGDLSANMGFIGDAGRAEVQTAIQSVLAAVKKVGKHIGIFAPGHAGIRYAQQGFQLIAIGSDVNLLSKGSDLVLQQFKEAGSNKEPAH